MQSQRDTIIAFMQSSILALPSFSRHGKAQASLALLIWLIENVQALVAVVSTALPIVYNRFQCV